MVKKMALCSVVLCSVLSIHGMEEKLSPKKISPHLQNDKQQSKKTLITSPEDIEKLFLARQQKRARHGVFAVEHEQQLSYSYHSSKSNKESK